MISLVGEDAMGQVKRLQRALGVPTSIEPREDAPAIRLGAVDDVAAAEQLEERGGRGGRSERPRPQRDFGERGPRNFERRDGGDRPRRDFAERGPREDRGFGERGPRREFGDRGPRDFAERGPRPERSFNDRPQRDFADRGNSRGPVGAGEAVVSFFNDAKGFGFATDAKGDDLFIHFSSIQGEGFKTLSQGQKITFEEAQGPKGREARNVRAVGGGGRGPARGGSRERRY